MAPVIYLRIEPYDPDAVDGDGDGIVQERTAWERPLGTRIFDELGREIARGATSGTAMPGSRVVDRNGNPIEYTPTYARGAGAKPRSVLGATLGESRASRTLGASGASLGQRVGGLNQNMVPDPPPAPPPAPEPRRADVPSGPPGSPEAIRQRNAEVISQIEELGGMWDFGSAPHEVREEFIDREKAKVGMMLPQADRRSGRERITENMDSWKRVVQETAEKWDKMAASERAAGRTDTAELFEGRAVEQRKVLDYLEKTPPQQVADDLVLLIREAVDDEDTKLAVQMPHGKLDDFLAAGYKTTHEVHSEHSQPRERTAYEATQGIPAEAPASVRPASGYLQFGARRRRAQELEQRDMEKRGAESNARVGVPDPALSTGAKSDIEGSVGGTYGDVQLILKDDVKGRTRFGMGDSYNSSIRSAPLEGATDDQLLDAALATDGGKGRDTNATEKRLMDLLNIVANGGDAARLGEKPRGRITTESGGDYANETTEYWESLIFGAFDIMDVDEIVIPEDKIPGMPERRNQETTAEWLKQTIRNNPGILQVIPMADLMELQQLMEEKPEAAAQAMGALVNVVNAIEEKGAKDRYKEKFLSLNPGLKVSFTNRNGTTEFTPARYGLEEGADIDQFLQGRIEFHVGRILDELRGAPTPDTISVASHPFDDIETKVSRIKLKLEPYDPDAQDGDGDGIVQEGTAWERPLGVRIFRPDGIEIGLGETSAQIVSGLRYVDGDGNDVDFTPGFMRDRGDADVSKPSLGAIPTLGQRARGENPNEPKLPKPQRRPKVPRGQEELEDLREDVEYDEGMQEIASRLGTPDDPVDWEDPYDVVNAERLGYEGTEGLTDDEGFPLETREAWLNAYLDDAFASDWAQWGSCRNIRKMAYLLAGIIPGAGDPNLWRSQGYFGNGWGSTDGYGDDNPDIRMEQALFIMALLRQARQNYDDESYGYQIGRRFYRSMDTDDIDGFLKEMQEGAIVDIPIISASTNDRVGDKHVLSRRDANDGRGYGDMIIIEFEGEGVDFLSSGELTYIYTEADELRDLMAIAELIQEDIATREADEDDEDFDPEQFDDILEAVEFLEQNYRDPTQYAEREKARQIVRSHVEDYDPFGGRPYREAGATIDEGKDSEAFWDAVEGTEDGKVKEVITGGRFEVVSIEEDETGSPYEYRVKLRQISVFDPMNPGATTGEDTPETPEERPAVTARAMGANLPGDPDADLPAEMFDEPDMDVVAALDQSYDQTVVRHIVAAFMANDFSWILDQLRHGTSIDLGEDDGVDASLADIAYFIAATREMAQSSAERDPAYRDGFLYVWRGGAVEGVNEPVSVTTEGRGVAERYGEPFYYRLPLSAVQYEEDRGEPGEYVVDPTQMELVEGPERQRSEFQEFISNLISEGVSGADRTNEEELDELLRRYDDGEIDDAELQELQFEIQERARRELFDELSRLTGDYTGETLSAWVDNLDYVTHDMRENVIAGGHRDLLEIIDGSPPRTRLYRGMYLSRDEVEEMKRSGRVVLPLAGTSRDHRAASEHGDVIFEIRDAKAFPAYLFSRYEEEEWLVSGEFEIVDSGTIETPYGEKTVFSIRPTGRDFLRNREDILSNSPMPTEEGEPPTTPKSIRTAPEPELPDWVTDEYDEDDLPEEFLGVDEGGFILISKDSEWLPDDRNVGYWHGSPTRITDDYVSTAASVGSMHRYDDLFVDGEEDYDNHSLRDMNGEPLPHWDRVWAGTPRIASEYAGLVGADWGDAYMYGLKNTGRTQETMDGVALEEDGHEIVRKFRFIDPDVLDEIRRDNPGILFERHRGGDEERLGPANLQVREYGDENQYVEVEGFELHGREYTVSRGGDSVGRGQYNGYLIAYDSDGNKVGYIDYQLDPDDPDTVHIAMIEVEPHARREGIGTSLVQALAAENRDKRVEWGMLTDDGAKLRQRLIGDYPRLAGERGEGLPEAIDDLLYDTFDGDPQDVIDEYDIQLPDGFESPDGPVGRLPDGRYVSFTQNRDGTYDIEVHDSFFDIIDKFDLDELEAEIAEEQWREVSASEVYHGTDPANMESIGISGLRLEDKTRGLSNRSIGPSVFTSLSSGSAGYYYGEVLEIDVPRMVADGYITRDDVMREPGFDRDDAISRLAQAFDDEWVGDSGVGGEAPDTFIFSKPIPAKYISRNGVPLEERTENGLIRDREDGGYTVMYGGEEVEIDMDFDVSTESGDGPFNIEDAGEEGARWDWTSWTHQAAIRAAMSRITGLPYIRGAGSLEWEETVGVDVPEAIYNGDTSNPVVDSRFKNYVAKAYGMLRNAARGRRNNRELYRGMVVKDSSPIMRIADGDEIEIPPSSFGYSMETASGFIVGGQMEPSDALIDMEEGSVFGYEVKSVIFRLAPGSKGAQGIESEEAYEPPFEQITGGKFRVIGVKDVDPLDDRRFDLEEQLDNGEITQEQYDEMLREINNSPDVSYREIEIEQIEYFDPDRGRMVRNDEEDFDVPSSSEPPDAPSASEASDEEPVEEAVEEAVEEQPDSVPASLVIPRLAAFRQRVSILRRLKNRNRKEKRMHTREVLQSLEEEGLIEPSRFNGWRDGLNGQQELMFEMYGRGVLDLELTEDGVEAVEALIEAGEAAQEIVDRLEALDKESKDLDDQIEKLEQELKDIDRQRSALHQKIKLAATDPDKNNEIAWKIGDLVMGLPEPYRYQQSLNHLEKLLETTFYLTKVYEDGKIESRAVWMPDKDIRLALNLFTKILDGKAGKEAQKQLQDILASVTFNSEDDKISMTYEIDKWLYNNGIAGTSKRNMLRAAHKASNLWEMIENMIAVANEFDLDENEDDFSNKFEGFFNYTKLLADMMGSKTAWGNFDSLYNLLERRLSARTILNVADVMEKSDDLKGTPQLLESLQKQYADVWSAHNKLKKIRNKTRLRIITQVLQANRASIGKGKAEVLFTGRDALTDRTGKIIPRRESATRSAVSREQIEEWLDMVSQLYPAEWLENLPTYHEIGWGARGHYSPSKLRIQLDGEGERALSVLAHEIMHGIQYHNLEISAAERLFLSYLIRNHPDANYVPRKYKDDPQPYFEMGFNQKYATKIYRDGITEISTVGMDHLVRNQNIIFDRGIEAYILGLLLTL